MGRKWSISNLWEENELHILILASLPHDKPGVLAEDIYQDLVEDGYPEVNEAMVTRLLKHMRMNTHLPLWQTKAKKWYWQPVGDMRDEVDTLFRKWLVGDV